MANKKKLKQRKRKQLQRQLKRMRITEKVTPKVTTYLPPVPVEVPATRRTDLHDLHQQSLNEEYNGAVVALNSYINDHATLCYKCSECGLTFFNKPILMINSLYQRHECGERYAGQAGSRGNSKNGKSKKKKKETVTIDQFNKMVWDDMTHQEITQKLKVNPKIVKDWFKAEGLIQISSLFKLKSFWFRQKQRPPKSFKKYGEIL